MIDERTLVNQLIALNRKFFVVCYKKSSKSQITLYMFKSHKLYDKLRKQHNHNFMLIY